MTIVCNIWMICLELNWLFHDPSWMLLLSEFVWALCSLKWFVFNNFLLIDATDRSKISSDQKRLFFAVSLYPFHFSRTLPLNFFFSQGAKDKFRGKMRESLSALIGSEEKKPRTDKAEETEPNIRKVLSFVFVSENETKAWNKAILSIKWVRSKLSFVCQLDNFSYMITWQCTISDF